VAEEGDVQKILERDALIQRIRELKQAGQRIVFTNGCFDILHPGHIRFLREARKLGDTLVVGVNSDRSVRELKGPQRPILTELERCELLSGLESVSYVTVFNESTPLGLIQAVLPHILVKGGDWGLTQIVGREEVEGGGGTVTSLPYEKGQSTSGIIDRILSRYRP
jgi:rfaE bifunctional protein nucleotidyltransferase chain/domain